MKRYKSKTVFDMVEDKDGSFVRFSDAAEAMQSALMFAIQHQEDIEGDINDFGELKPLLDMAKSAGSVH